jgi:hypothetical protein
MKNLVNTFGRYERRLADGLNYEVIDRITEKRIAFLSCPFQADAIAQQLEEKRQQKKSQINHLN